jgi:hypothetical protein
LEAITKNGNSIPPGFDLVFCEKVEQSKIPSVAQRAVVVDLALFVATEAHAFPVCELEKKH